MNQQLLCSQCGQACEADQAFCPQCGSSLPASDAPTLPGKQISPKGSGEVTCFPCPACENLITDGSAYCNFCGQSVGRQPGVALFPAQKTVLAGPRKKPQALRLSTPKITPAQTLPIIESLSSFLARLLQTPRCWIWFPLWAALAVQLIADNVVPILFPPQQHDLPAAPHSVMELPYSIWSMTAGTLLMGALFLASLLMSLGVLVAWCASFKKHPTKRSGFLGTLFPTYLLYGFVIGPIALLGDLLPNPGYALTGPPGIMSIFVTVALILVVFLYRRYGER
jgi:RNA polymerase subunit RPABC4/transcription elongation factor Spt4